MRVATFNTRHGAHDGTGLRAQVADGRGLRSSVTLLDADVVALQEVDRRVLRSWCRDQAAMLAPPGSGRVARFAPARRVLFTGHDGVALVVRGIVRTTRTLALPGRAAPRVALFARVESDDGLPAVTVVATHLQNRVRSGPAEAPMQLDAMFDELSRWPEPWVLAGDLNLRPDVVVPALAAAGLTPLRAGHTYPAGAPRIEIDWLAVRGLRAIGEARTVQLPVGDHRALVADVTVPS